MANTLTKKTAAEYLAEIEACGGDLSQDEMINLLFAEGPNAAWTELSMAAQAYRPYSMYNYLTNRLPMTVWEDWNGVTELGTQYHAAHIPFDMSIFRRSMEICSPGSANECRWDYCEIPKGGISRMPPLEMYRTGFKTPPFCIANIRTSKQAKAIAQKLSEERYHVDDQVLNIFFTMAMIRLLGHKWVLEAESAANGLITPVANEDPHNSLQGFRYHYMEPLFPQAGNLNNIIPLDTSVLDQFGRGLVESKNPNFISKGPRGEPIFELLYSEDWYRSEILLNPEYIDRMKYTMPTSMLPGYTDQEGGEKEIIGNFHMRTQPGLPKFAESTEGGLTVVQPMRSVAVDEGYKSMYNFREHRNAPFLLTVFMGDGLGEILTRPTISVGIDGKPIHPITSNPKSDWEYWNEYDKDCNPEKNMPYHKKKYEMGLKSKNPDAGWGMISRARIFRLRATNTCDLRDVLKIKPETQDCAILTVGCNDTKNPSVSNNIMQEDNTRRVKCSSKFCGDSTNLYYNLQVRREAIDSITPKQNPLGTCVCGDTIQVHISDADGDVVKVRSATLQSYVRPNMINPDYNIVVKLASSLSAGECISYVGCPDGTPTTGLAISCADSTEDEDIDSEHLRVQLNSSLNCNVGATVTLEYLDEDQASLDPAQTDSAVIVSVDPNTLTYVLDFGAEKTCALPEGACYFKITCA